MICQGEKFLKPEEVLEPKVHFSVTFNKEKMEKSNSSSENNAGKHFSINYKIILITIKNLGSPRPFH